MEANNLAIDFTREKSVVRSSLWRIRKFFRDISGVLSVLWLIINTLSVIPLFFITAMFKLIPVKFIKKYSTAFLDLISTTWVDVNSFYITFTKKIDWDIRGLDNIDKKHWYLVMSNHQAWSDIVVLQKIFNRRIPMLKFFLKKELIWVPVLGFCWWALDFPFMKRYSKTDIQKKPSLAGKDIESTRKACEKFKTIPVSVMNFVEGSRFTRRKKIATGSPYKNLLIPRAGGIGFVISSMGEYLTDILNVTIKYEGERTSFWGFLSGRVSKVIVNVEVIPVTDEIIGDYTGDAKYRERFQIWLNQLWKKKDNLIDEL